MKANFVELGNVAQFINGAAFKPEDWCEDGLKIIRIQNLTDETKPFNCTKRVVDKKLIVEKGDILVSWSATLGVFEWKRDESALLNQHIFRVIPNNNLIDKNYLRNVLSSALNDMNKHLHGATMKHVNRGEFLATKIPLPPLAEQRRIAEILDKAEEIKRKREQAIAKLDELANSAFEAIFNETKIINHFKLKDLALKKTIKDPDGKQVFNLTLDKIDSNTGEINSVEFIEKSKLGTSTYYFETPVILFSKLRPYLNKVAYPKNNGYATTELVPLYCNSDRIAPFFLLTYLRSKKFVEFANLNSGGAKMPRVMMDKFWSHEVAVPSMPLQLKFCQLFESIQDQKHLLRNNLHKLEKISESLQSQAFTTGFNA